MKESPFPIWPDAAPGARGQSPKDIPTLTPYMPGDDAQPTGASIIICPGGGYGNLADHEGGPVAEWLASHGVTAFVLRYRHAPDYHHPYPLMDLRRAVKTVRGQAFQNGLDSNRVGIMGFSAGGHLAACAATLYDYGNLEAEDPVERWNSRPNALMLIYPVISLEEHAHEGSRANLLGPNAFVEEKDAGEVTTLEQELLDSIRAVCADRLTEEENEEQEREENKRQALIDSLSPHKQVTSETPPTFFVHAMGDTAVPPENSMMFAQAMRQAGAPVEMHLYEEGPHGFGLARNLPALGTWRALCTRWLLLRGFVNDADRL